MCPQVDDNRLESLFGQLWLRCPDQGNRVQTANQLRTDNERGRVPLPVARPTKRHSIESMSKTTLRFRSAVRRDLALARWHVVQSQCSSGRV